MTGGLVLRPRAAAATAVGIVAAVAITAALFPSATSPSAGLPAFPTHGREEACGRMFLATEATEGGKPHEFAGDGAPTFTFYLDRSVEIFTGCNYIAGKWRLIDNRFAIRDGGITAVGCNQGTADVDGWMAEFLDHHPEWRLDGNTLKLSSDFGTMNLIDKGEGREREDILGHQFVSMAIWEPTEYLDSSRFPPNVWARLSITREGQLQASFGCETLDADAQIASGWLVIPDWISPRTQPCSRSMKAHDPDWFWDFLRPPIRWQSSFYEGLTLASESTTLTFDGIGNGMYSNDPNVLRDKAFRSTSMNGGGHKRVGIELGWLRYVPSDRPRDDCPKRAAEEWLDDFFADEPSWHLSRGGLLLVSPRTRMTLAPTGGD